MNSIKHLVFFVSCIALVACKKDFDLPRDNPFDQNFDGNDSEKKRTLSFSSQNVACKADGFQYTDENFISPGDKIWLNIVMENTGNATINEIRGTITSSSNKVMIAPTPTGKYLKFSQSSASDDSIGVGKTGWGKFTDGQNFKFAPNYNSYSVEFQVDSSSHVGDNIDFQINTNDKIGNTWTETFTITLK